MLQDLRYAWRSLRATPRMALTAVACAALSLGAAIFMTTLVRAVLFVTPSIPDADRLVRVRDEDARHVRFRSTSRWTSLRTWRARYCTSRASSAPSGPKRSWKSSGSP